MIHQTSRPAMRRTVTAACLVVCAVAPGAVSANTAHASDADTAVGAWNFTAGEAARAACLSPENDPLHEARMYAIAHVAIHDALNTIDRRFEPYAYDARVSAPTSVDAAVAAAVHDVLVATLEDLP